MQCLYRKMSDYQFEDSPNPFGKMPGQRFKDTNSQIKKDNFIYCKFWRKGKIEANQTENVRKSITLGEIIQKPAWT